MEELLQLELDENHVYWLNNVEIPGCTSILAAVGATTGFGFLKPDELEFYRTRGHAVHKAVELFIRGELDHSTLAPEVKPRLKGWKRFVKDYAVKVATLDGEPFSERQLYHPAYRYGVTPDVVAEVKGHGICTIELKATSAHAPATGLQLAAQRLAIQTVFPAIGETRIGLRLTDKEPFYDLKFYSDRTDEAVWLNCLNVYRWRQKHRLL